LKERDSTTLDNRIEKEAVFINQAQMYIHSQKKTSLILLFGRDIREAWFDHSSVGFGITPLASWAALSPFVQ